VGGSAPLAVNFLNRNMIVFGEIIGAITTGNAQRHLLFERHLYRRPIKHFVAIILPTAQALITACFKYDYLSSVGQGTFNATSLGLTISIGNQWPMENFNIGCDWSV